MLYQYIVDLINHIIIIDDTTSAISYKHAGSGRLRLGGRELVASHGAGAPAGRRGRRGAGDPICNNMLCYTMIYYTILYYNIIYYDRLSYIL